MTARRVNNARNTPGRPFRPGNPGRPRGARNRSTRLAEKLMTEDLEAVTKSVVNAAIGGDMAAARIILDRLAPIRRGRPVQFTAPETMDAAGLADAFTEIVRAMAVGELTPEEAVSVANVLEVRRRTLETVELEARLRAIEEGARR
jgi:hypothetical protein